MFKPITTWTHVNLTYYLAGTDYSSILNSKIHSNWRNVNAGTGIRPTGGHNCDTRDMNDNYAERPWFRFARDAGNMMLNSCPSSSSCGTHAGMWTDEEMPSAVGESIVISVYGSYSNKCKYGTWSILVMRCSNDTDYDFIYQYNEDATSCSYSFCGMSQS